MDRQTSWVGVIVVVAVSVAGCASTPVERKEASLVDLHDSMVAIRGQIDKTLASLNGLTSASPDRLPATYQQFAKDTDKIAEQAATVDEESRQLQTRSAEWLAGWRKSQAEVQDPELKALSERRHAQALERIQNIDRSLAEAREAFAPFVANLQDVKQVVGNDLTPNGVAAVSGTAVVQNANQAGGAAARALDATIADLEVLTQTLTPVSSR
ncbi:hypothetical protein SVA_2796 [Sulfurifustis variabilis]|uniref:Uncharacterized protein n=1 Tax=Sulfurifustis variabilis TaxID=1675686 RepID=A0A1B4VB77_9GAMM|nr:hypothetical protein SVA_2796 [Sulfurifustis variabilis]